jgi:hypothetical protein
MLLPGNVHSAPSGTVGFDSDTVITFSPAQRFAQQDGRSSLRYLSLTAREASGDLFAMVWMLAQERCSLVARIFISLFRENPHLHSSLESSTVQPNIHNIRKKRKAHTHE